MKINKIIISGPPGSGKTSIINALKSNGFLVKKELHPGNIKMETDKLEVSSFLFNKRIKQYLDITMLKSKKPIKKLLKDSPFIFFDRSTIDVVAYLKMWKIEYPLEWNSVISKHQYHRNIFYTPCWKEIYKTTKHRPEKYDKAKKIDLFLRKAYLKFNYNIIEVPKLDINKRVDFIINQL